MAKIRVFELARDLNMTNKVLLEKMRDLDIAVASHLSSLEDEEVAKIKENVVGGKHRKSEAIQMKPTIIRRRREVVAKEPVPEEKPPVPEFSLEPAKTVFKAEHPVEEPVPVTPSPVEEKPETLVGAHADEEMDLSEKPDSESPVSSLLSSSELPSVVEAVVEETSIATKEQSIPVEMETEEEPVSDDLLSSPKNPSSIILEKPESETSSPLVFTPDVRADRTGKKKKKIKKDMPAKIIKLPAPVAELPASVLARTTETVQESDKDISIINKTSKIKIDKFQQIMPEVVPLVEKPKEPVVKDVIKDKDKKKKKIGKEIEEEVVDKKLVKKKIPFRKKEIVEGADLYSESPRLRKGGKKTGKGGRSLPVLQKPLLTTPKAIKRRIKVDDTIAIAELAKRMGVKASEIIMKLMGMGVMTTLNQVVDYDTAALVATEFNFEVERAAFEEDSFLKIDKEDPAKN